MDEKVRSIEISKQVPIVGNYDVVVCGGGPADFIAAIAVARSGTKAAVVEQYGFLGGMATMGLVTPLSVSTHNNEKMIGGIPWELIEWLEKMGGCIIEKPLGNVAFDPELYRPLCQQIMLEAGVDVHIRSYLGDCQVEDGKISCILFENKNGTEVVSIDTYIDCTGDGDPAAMAGAPTQTDECKSLQPLSTHFILGGVNTDSPMIIDAMHHNKQGQNRRCIAVREKLLAMKEELGIPEFGGPWSCTTLRPGEVTVNITCTAGNVINSRNFTAAEWRLREDVLKIVRTPKENFEESKNSYVTTAAVHASIREIRRIKDIHTITVEGCVNAYKYSDSIPCGAHPIDIHVAAGAEQGVTLLKKMVYVPYRALITEDFPSLFVAGCCISADKTSFVSLRVQASYMGVGQAAGVATTQCIKADVTVQKADIDNLIGESKKLGAII